VIKVGDEAPDFTLKDQNNEEFTLSAHRGKQAVLIVFYPLAFTGICTGELCVVRDDLSTFENDDVLTVSISVDSVYSHKIFAEREGYEFPLLSDFWPHGAVARSYGVFHEKVGAALRGSFLIDRGGVVRWSVVNGIGEARDLAGYRAALAAA
jgi:peroxiredoxin